MSVITVPSLRAVALVVCLFTVSGCETMQSLTPTPKAVTSTSKAPEETMRLAHILRDDGRLAAAYEIYAGMDKKGQLSPRELLEYASVAAYVLPPQDALPLFVRARQQLAKGGQLAADERLAVCLGIGRGRLALGQLEGAEESFRCVLEVDGNNVAALNGLGVTLSALGRATEANTLLSHALEQDPSNSAVLNNLALGKLGAGDPQAAIALLDTGNALRSPTLALNLALAYLLQDNEGQAQRVLAQNFPGIRTDPLLDTLKESATRIRGGQSPASELLAASRRSLPLETR
ncbi:tetratricopeptide repeat protein [Insolitispirillum peregrinum]|uniref:Tetratricopeptide repeat-containing protein n=1 Tax=Insolitispirillum peregrinum TaxID=80876 RepID=A0A1N7QCK5_9PROT|nr:tetratricopeptide repeat protein [Insolitispirillum peregrinum]SIT20600.1 Tetratricopeptide repeat-containing protein [Insolitispirillum peregrinum]